MWLHIWNMDIVEFYRIVAAILIGNAFTLLVVYAVWRASKLERKGFNSSFLPFPLLASAIIPFAIVFFAVMSLD